MRNALAFAALLTGATPQPVATPADYPVCITVNPGPVARPDHYTAHPKFPLNGAAPVSPLS